MVNINFHAFALLMSVTAPSFISAAPTEPSSSILDKFIVPQWMGGSLFKSNCSYNVVIFMSDGSKARTLISREVISARMFIDSDSTGPEVTNSLLFDVYLPIPLLEKIGDSIAKNNLIREQENGLEKVTFVIKENSFQTARSESHNITWSWLTDISINENSSRPWMTSESLNGLFKIKEHHCRAEPVFNMEWRCITSDNCKYLYKKREDT